jgi:type II secretory pathway pseudopilin PulG
LIELMAVVTITAILALIGVSLFRHQLLASKGAEAASVIQAIRSAQEAYAAENHVFLNVSTGGGAVDAFDSKWYPTLVPNTGRSSWVQAGHVDYPRWRALAPSVNRSVMFGYLVYAGAAGSNVPALALAQDPGFPKPMTLDWYVIQARGDADGNGVFAQYAASNKTSELVVENEGE